MAPRLGIAYALTWSGSVLLIFYDTSVYISLSCRRDSCECFALQPYYNVSSAPGNMPLQLFSLVQVGLPSGSELTSYKYYFPWNKSEDGIPKFHNLEWGKIRKGCELILLTKQREKGAMIDENKCSTSYTAY